MALPKTFVDLATAYNSAPETFVNIIGIVVDLMPTTTTTSGQHMLTIKLLDRHLHDSIYGNQGLRIRFFRADRQSLPKVQKHGDVVLLRNIKMTSFSQQPMAISNYQTEVTVFPTASIPEPNFEIAYQGKHRLQSLGVPHDVQKLSLGEQSYVVQLKHDMGATVQSIAANVSASRNESSTALPPAWPSAPVVPSKRPGENLSATEPKKSKFGNKFRLIQGLRHYDFADVCVQAVKKFPTHFGTCELYVTDYTENKEMFYYTPPEEEDERERDGDTFGYTGAPKRSWPGPYGQLVLKVEVKEPHAHYVNTEVTEGDFVLLRNVRIKVFKHLEANMWPEARNPEQVQITKLNNLAKPEIAAVLERKEKYWAARNVKISKSEPQEEKKKPTKSEKKKQKKQQQRDAEQGAAAAGSGNSKTSKSTSDAQNGNLNGLAKVDVNPHVRCSHEEVPTSSIKDILDPTNEKHTTTTPDGMKFVLPFVNAKYRARARVVDYDPKQLEEFSLPELPEDEQESEDTPMMDYDSSPKYEWSFSLELEDASKPKGGRTGEDRIWINVHHTDAQYLFGNDMDDPNDLNNDHRLLSKLREKLCILWGNLEEKSDGEQISNRPFECCLAEYGIEMDEHDPEKALHPFGWKRMYSMFGVTIL